MPTVQCRGCERLFEVPTLNTPVPADDGHDSCPGAGELGHPVPDIGFDHDEQTVIIKNTGA